MCLLRLPAARPTVSTLARSPTWQLESIVQHPRVTLLEDGLHRRLPNMLAVEQLLPKAARAFSTSAAVHQAVPAVATQGKGFLASLFGSGKRVDVPLTDALPGVVIPEAVAPPKDAPVTQLTKLSNGFTVATENTPVRLAQQPVPVPRGIEGLVGVAWGARVGLWRRAGKGLPSGAEPRLFRPRRRRRNFVLGLLQCRVPLPPWASMLTAAVCTRRRPPRVRGARVAADMGRQPCVCNSAAGSGIQQC